MKPEQGSGSPSRRSAKRTRLHDAQSNHSPPPKRACVANLDRTSVYKLLPERRRPITPPAQSSTTKPTLPVSGTNLSLTNGHCISATNGGGQSLQQLNNHNLAKLNSLDAYEKAMTIYRALANHGSQVMLQRSLSYNRLTARVKSRERTPVTNSAPSSPLSLAIDLDSVSDLSALPGPVNLTVFALRVHSSCSQPSASRFDLEGDEAQVTLLRRHHLELGEDGRRLRGQSLQLPEIPPLTTANTTPTTPNRGRKRSQPTSVWLLFHLSVQTDAESLTSGGRSLRNVAQRRSIRAELLNGSPASSAEQHHYLALSFLTSVAKPEPLLHKPLSLHLLPRPDSLAELNTMSRMRKAQMEELRELRKEAVSAEVGMPHLKLALRKTKSPFTVFTALCQNGSSGPSSSQNGRSPAPSSRRKASASPKKTLHRFIPPDLQLPPRLLYRFSLEIRAPEETGEASSNGGVEERTASGTEERTLSTEADDPGRCPVCRVLLGDMYGLLSHLRHCHSRLSFLYKPGSEEELPVIDVGINALFDGAWETGSTQRAYRGQRETAPGRRAGWTELLRWSGRAAGGGGGGSLDEFRTAEKSGSRETGGVSGHQRAYFHSVSLAPVEATEGGRLEEGVEWLQVATCRNLADYSDVNDGEKRLMMAWNLFAIKHRNRYISRRSMEDACWAFLRQHGPQLASLRRNLALHLCAFFHRRLLTLSAFRALSAALPGLTQPS